MTKPRKHDPSLFEAPPTTERPEPPKAQAAPAPARAKKRKPEPTRESRAVVVASSGPPVASADVPPPQPVNLLSLVAQAITNPEIDGPKLRELVDWYDRREADNAFARDFLAMSKELPEIRKDGTIDQGITRSGRQGVKAKYATYENIHTVTTPILQRHGFTLSIRNELRGEQTVVILRLEHYDQRFGASFRESLQPIIRDDGPGKTVVQAWGSGEQYQQRRMVIKLLNLRSRAAVDDDRDGEPAAKEPEPTPISPEQLKELREKIAATDGRITEKRVCEKYGVKKLEALPVASHLDACRALDNVIEAARG